jgi:hypothetical protein
MRSMYLGCDIVDLFLCNFSAGQANGHCPRGRFPRAGSRHMAPCGYLHVGGDHEAVQPEKG